MALDAHIRVDGRAGRITLDRAHALNALTHQVCIDTLAALNAWEGDERVRLVILDATGARAFCAGGDIAYMHAAMQRGDPGAGRRFWRDEYRMNARLASYSKPIVSFLHGYVMGGGVGFGCHASHRVVGESARVAMPECAIGLIPDTGGSHLLARAPGRLGLHLGLTGARMGPGDAIHAGFADHHIPEADWPPLIAALCADGDVRRLDQAAHPAPDSPLAARAPAIDTALDAAFAAADGASGVAEALDRLAANPTGWAQDAAAALRRASPLCLVGAARVIVSAEAARSIQSALRQEYRWTWRSLDHGDFAEGIRAQIIDRDQAPRWTHATIADVSEAEVEAMLAPLDTQELSFDTDIDDTDTEDPR